jgi:cellobiose phosphorylase
MRHFFGGNWMAGLAMALALVAFTPVCQARSNPDKQAQKAEKHAQKIQKKLARYKTGTYLHLVLNNNAETSGTLNTLSDTSFTFNNAETNAKETHLYSDVYQVEKGKAVIGQGSAPHHRIHIF